ncbi:endoplasmic reticulum lectin 1 isoform X1 [Danaus plexippus]|uniref:endoplasmic reticulum lectin 1 isoform X1 n=1 Tax=Danaus plexippus TaxID=13037 RepID=UPI002AB20050|nr:endoplasmic reticulum lectin 1 isoform X1 [Danaus plexippus]
MKPLWVVLLSVIGVLSIEHDLKGFDDSILFRINFDHPSGEGIVGGEEKFKNKDFVKVVTSHKERYDCYLPELQEKESTGIQDYDGPSPINLMKPLFSQKICSYRLESYWSYEVCHGRYIRQYHEEREGKQIKTQEYFLGHWSAEKQTKLEEELKAKQESKSSLKTTKVEGLNLPYIELKMDDGTVCDLSGKPRLTRVLYVCFSHGKHEVYSFKEIATCEYEMIILSPLLCEHPLYKPKDVGQNDIDCIPRDGAPIRPRNMLKNEIERVKFQHQTLKLLSEDKEARDVVAVLKVEKIDKDGETHLKFELHPLEDPITDKVPVIEAPKTVRDEAAIKAFLNGETCLNGGTGWWKYEFCYGRHVIQYHEHRGGDTEKLLLGSFDEAEHLQWIKENRNKAPKPIDERTSVSHFYSGGDICQKSGKRRQTEVKLKCLQNSSSPAQVSLYLLEPRTCHYILGVESPLICDILPMADDNGLIKYTQPAVETPSKVVIKEEEDDVIKLKELNKFGLD